ncbi:2-hydroxyacyl-CoA dehydratase family protein [Haloimpatiens lingqiaonensis]|uniref:2-hydroxyacyl-CoA dehydratase family protein n=1 Tax=Haloimpatiens lingqiaonensis TaxID=1380675 RepID=UPI0010FE6F93|nr:2-hydroxyacyl-CoA dehydratase family protein [Haloimpatiens lingqiaonensis]
MIGYLCKYTPIHIIESFGEDTYKINPQIYTFDKCNYLTHNNMCSYIKAVIDECYNKKIDKLVLVNCCDSIRRLYDILKKDPLFKFIYLIDMPRKINNNSYKLFHNEILKFISALEDYFHKPFSMEYFLNTIGINKSVNTESFNEIPKNTLLLIGARLENYLLESIKNNGYSIYDITCTNNQCALNETLKLKNALNHSKEEVILWKEKLLINYCKDLLNQFPCMRMCDISKRYNFIEKNKQNIKGIIYHTIKFCDYYSFDYTYLKSNVDIPILKIDTDFLIQGEGQIKTRLEVTNSYK